MALYYLEKLGLGSCLSCDVENMCTRAHQIVQRLIDPEGPYLSHPFYDEEVPWLLWHTHTLIEESRSVEYTQNNFLRWKELNCPLLECSLFHI